MNPNELPNPALRFDEQKVEVLLGQCIWGEARGECGDSRLGVGNVVKNRVRSGIFPGGHDWKRIILAPLQFSCFNPSDPNRLKMAYPTDPRWGNEKTWEECYKLACEVLDGRTKDNTENSTFYHSFKDPHDPRVSWANHPRYEYVLTIGALHFFRDTWTRMVQAETPDDS